MGNNVIMASPNRLYHSSATTTMNADEDVDPMAALMKASSAIGHDLADQAASDNNWVNDASRFDAVTAAARAATQHQQFVLQQSQPLMQAHHQPQLKPSQSQVRHCAALHPHQLSPDAVLCVRCGYAGADVRIKCDRSCSFHARCIDLVSLSGHHHHHGAVGGGGSGDSIRIQVCPSCTQSANGLEIIPLSFMELDRVQRTAMQQTRPMMGSNSTNGLSSSPTEAAMGGNKKRSSSELDLDFSVSMSSSKCYDPSVPRTGRWTDEELTFRDTIITHFLEGSLPLSNGLKLNDFLANILKSKQSRLTKKMKHAKLSTKYFRIKDGYIQDIAKAKEFSEQECNFITCVSDPVERSEIQFHMQKEWRDHLAERCAYLRIMLDAEKWLQSVDQMDRRVVLEKNQSRMNKRRMLMGKALETDVADSIPGVFINQESRTDDSVFEVDGDLSNLTGEDGDFGKYLMSMIDDGGGSGGSSNAIGTKKKSHAESRRVSDPNFRYAAPFLAAITSYMERNSIPFEHVDLWVPSVTPPAYDRELGSAPQMPSMGSGANLRAMTGSNDNRSCRLCFAGSATLSTQVVETSINSSNSTASLSNAEEKQNSSKSVAPLSDDEIFNFSLYGDYSEKFSFNVGCGLPGRVFKTGIAAWEQFVTNAPCHMFERRGGAMQFGVKTALGLPIESPNVGRIVLVMYSKHNREKDEELVNRVVKDMGLFNPCPRWKLVVSVQTPASGDNQGTSSMLSAPPSKLENASNNSNSTKQTQINQLISLLGESMPSASESNTPLAQMINSIMSLRLILLRPIRSEEEDQLVDTILVLFQSYLSAGRSKEDIVLLVTRDYDFHIQHNQRVSSMMQQQSMMMSMSPPMAPLPGPMLQGGYSETSPAMRSFNHSSYGTDGVGSFLPGMGAQQGWNLMQQQVQNNFGSMPNLGLNQGGMTSMDRSASDASLKKK